MDATTLAALGEPSRLQIVELLRDGPFAVGQIVDALTMRQPQVSKHLGVLREAGFVSVEPVARQRIYHLQPAPFEEIGAWVTSFERQWETRLDSLGTYLDALGERTGDSEGRMHARRDRST